jgi:hypothetical protein
MWRALLAATIAGAVLAGIPTVADARLPTGVQVRVQLRAAVRASRAHLKVLVVDTRAKKLRIDVSVSDPAAYLKHRYARVVEVVYPRLVARFAYIYLKVFDAGSGRAVLTYSDTPGFGVGAGRQQAWHIDWRLVDCARNLPLDDIEIDPDHAAPSCPAT